MDVISVFLLERSGKINLRALLQSLALLSQIQQERGFLEVSDVKKSLSGQQISLSNVECEFHGALIMECAMQPFISSGGTIRLKLRDDLMNNEQKFVRTVIAVLQTKCRGQTPASVVEFRQSVNQFFLGKAPVENNVSYATKAGKYGSSNSEKRFGSGQSGNFHRNVENCEPVVRFLAQVRKQGMDLLFPQITHDKVMISVFVCIKFLKSPAHRELIDVIMELKEDNIITNLEPVSKTKIRGVLALMKHADILQTHGHEGQPVELLLSSDITSYEDLRKKHDGYLEIFVTENRVGMANNLWNEIVWKHCDLAKSQLVSETSNILENFFAKKFRQSLTSSGTSQFGGEKFVQERDQAVATSTYAPINNSVSSSMHAMGSNFSTLNANAAAFAIAAPGLIKANPGFMKGHGKFANLDKFQMNPILMFQQQKVASPLPSSNPSMQFSKVSSISTYSDNGHWTHNPGTQDFQGEEPVKRVSINSTAMLCSPRRMQAFGHSVYSLGTNAKGTDSILATKMQSLRIDETREADLEIQLFDLTSSTNCETPKKILKRCSSVERMVETILISPDFHDSLKNFPECFPLYGNEFANEKSDGGKKKTSRTNKWGIQLLSPGPVHSPSKKFLSDGFRK